MYPYFISILFIFFINYFISTILKKYTFEKFFIYVLVYFFIVSFYNLIYLKNINFFTIQTFFSVFILFLYAGLYRSVSVKIMIYLYLRKKSVYFNNLYKTQFKEKSFDKRIKILLDSNIIFKKKKYFFLSTKGKSFLNKFLKIQSIYKIKSSG